MCHKMLSQLVQQFDVFITPKHKCNLDILSKKNVWRLQENTILNMQIAAEKL